MVDPIEAMKAAINVMKVPGEKEKQVLVTFTGGDYQNMPTKGDAKSLARGWTLGTIKKVEVVKGEAMTDEVVQALIHTVLSIMKERKEEHEPGCQCAESLAYGILITGIEKTMQEVASKMGVLN